MKKIARIVRHLLTPRARVRRVFPRASLRAIEAAIAHCESAHSGEVRFVVEGSLDGAALFAGQSPRERALELFARLHVWDTERNNGVLIYLLLADRAVEIVADRGARDRTGVQAWRTVCNQLEADLRRSDYEGGVIGAIESVARLLEAHFPAHEKDKNELSDRPLVL